eukprot:gb/GECG01012319.1/.p1 GENE.gb/GECG01012319.1/~~gb/GECG01012319.1/.p1  ORF type:complete len:115 (+),score=9.59 gb/GECG01012319.1/:1-345(+)
MGSRNKKTTHLSRFKLLYPVLSICCLTSNVVPMFSLGFPPSNRFSGSSDMELAEDNIFPRKQEGGNSSRRLQSTVRAVDCCLINEDRALETCSGCDFTETVKMYVAQVTAASVE